MNKNQIFETLKGNILEILPDLNPEHITLDNSMINLGANSIDRMDIIVDTMEKLNVNIPLVQFSQVSNLKELVDVLHAQQS
ncbi:acyl carrier protein [Marininema halotolerans]|uniref:Polyketide biosynthesis acyl carrier protein n=1 Tax=Marininema halotolerans TaxID=1155944 RepID=A0A1I6PRA1_9BACL|nr:acyl carrier protein [Marininema halotolerans]SFS42640.1 polyketide biosynthesis acyl carrier protein [Marininema halotolerans]